MKLRDYQEAAPPAAWDYIRERDGNPTIVLPTGAGKTPVIATLARDVAAWGGRTLIVAPRKELIVQTANTIREWYPDIDVGVYSAGLRSRETKEQTIVAGIQSIYRRGLELTESGAFDIALVDECHGIPPDGAGLFYQTLFDDLKVAAPHFRIIGLTATAYRLKGGYICGPDHWLNDICYEAGVRELIADGYLSRLTSKATLSTVDTSEIHVRGGEFIEAELAAAFDDDEKIAAAVDELIEYTSGVKHDRRKSVIVFCCNVAHATHVREAIEDRVGSPVGLITGETKPIIRDSIVDSFKRGALQYVVNVNVLTEGFDAKSVDCVALMRSTLSPGLYYQMVGRGLRIHPAKNDCLVLDFGDNIKRHGCIDDITVKPGGSGKGGEAPVKTCPECQTIVAANVRECPDCGTAFEIDSSLKHDTKASILVITTDQIKPVRYEIDSVSYCEHTKRNGTDDDPKTLRVTYYGGNLGLEVFAEEWICVEHTGRTREKASRWLARRTNATLGNFRTANDAAEFGMLGGFAEPTSIDVIQRPGKRFTEIVGYQLGEKPDPDPVLDRLAAGSVPKPQRKAKSLAEIVAGREPGDDGVCEDYDDFYSTNDEEIPF